MASDRFSSKVADWCKKTEVQQTAVLHQSLRTLDDEIKDNTPVVTGNTQNSRAVSALGPPPIDWSGKKFRNPDDAINNAIAGVAVGTKVWLGFRAPWAHKLEPKYAILRLAGQRWGDIVDQAARMLRR